MEARVGMSAHGGVVDGGTSTRKLIHHQHSRPKRQQQPVTQIGTVPQLLAGGIAGAFTTFPLDLVRRRMQLEGAAGRARVYNTGLFGTFRHIIRAEGLHGLYRGIMPEYYKVVPSVGIAFMTYETLKTLLSQGPFSS
ncbi:mitochondrial substrate carrier family B-like [Olea europaea subsp. europaea]|uniref:Mitochondrial substrate carrier family B-like n=1 Tax=Olea europaea subsp. europaea TaxID=158383 RepID=A0A8S0TDC8_OLEEU|nr:mitochondrial substrate carrier family B-like [Olea europaea subsp. europaea]